MCCIRNEKNGIDCLTIGFRGFGGTRRGRDKRSRRLCLGGEGVKPILICPEGKKTESGSFV
jgi:hypothetical protein